MKRISKLWSQLCLNLKKSMLKFRDLIFVKIDMPQNLVRKG